MQDNRPGSLPIPEEPYYHSDPSAYAADCEKIGVIIPNAVNPAYPDMADKLKRAAQAAGLCALVCNTDNSLRREADCLSVLLDANVSGIVAMPVCDESHELYVESGSPVVLYGCRTPEESLGYIAMDDILAGRIAAERLTAQGHRRLAFLSYPARSYAVTDRLNGFSTVVREKSAELMIANVSGGRLQDSFSAMLALLESDSPPTAIAASDDFTAIGAWQALREKQLPVGDGIVLLGFGNTPFAALPKHGLSSVGPVGEDQAAITISALQAMQNGLCGMRSRILLTPKLVCRSTFRD